MRVCPQDQSECEDGGEEDPLVDDAGVGALLGLDLDSLLNTFASEDTQAGEHEGGGNQADRLAAGPAVASAGRNNLHENDDVNVDLQPGEAIVPV